MSSLGERRILCEPRGRHRKFDGRRRSVRAAAQLGIDSQPTVLHGLAIMFSEKRATVELTYVCFDIFFFGHFFCNLSESV